MNSVRRNSHLTVDGIKYDVSNLFPTPSDSKEVVESLKLQRYATDSHTSPCSSLLCSSNSSSNNSISSISKKSTTNTRPTLHRSSSSRRRLLEKAPGSLVGSSRRLTTVVASAQQQRVHSPTRSKSYKVSATGTSRSLRGAHHPTNTATAANNLKQPPSYSLTKSSSKLYPSLALSQYPSDCRPLSKYMPNFSSFDIRKRPQQSKMTTNTSSTSTSPSTNATVTATTNQTNQDTNPMIEIEPGIFEPLRGSKETAAAVSEGFLIDVQCLCCTNIVRCIQDAKYFLCPLCKIVATVPQKKQQQQHPERGVESNHHHHRYSSGSGYVDVGFQGAEGGACYDRTSILFLRDNDEDRCNISSSSLVSQKSAHESNTRWGVGLGFLKHCD